jgi:hypothetical protein
MSAARARALVREVQRHDPSWRPQPSIYQGVEGQISANEFDAAQAAARLQQLGRPQPASRPLQEVLKPEGRSIGFRHKGASTEVRTVTSPEFEELLAQLSLGAQSTVTPPLYQGRWYLRPDGSIFGLRRSERYGMTFEVISSNTPDIRSGDKVHKK